jgi:hypothetical protein
MDQWMAASDLLIGKAGGLTSSEALACGLVLVIVNPIPGQEERNSDHFLEEGVAIRCNNLPALAYKIDALLADNDRFSRMQEAVKKLGRPHAASEIVSIVLDRIRRINHSHSPPRAKSRVPFVCPASRDRQRFLLSVFGRRLMLLGESCLSEPENPSSAISCPPQQVV